MPVNVRLELDTFFADLAQGRQRHHLEATRIRQDGPLPVHEFVQPAQLRNALCARSQHEVIGVAQQNIGTGGTHALRQHRLDRGGRAHGHEGRGTNRTAWQHQDAGAGRTQPSVDLELWRVHAPSLGQAETRVQPTTY